MIICLSKTHTKGDPIFNITNSENNMKILKQNMRLHFEKFLFETDDIKFIKLFEDKQTKNEFVEIFYNAVIQAEFEMFLGYKKYERTDLEKVNYGLFII